MWSLPEINSLNLHAKSCATAYDREARLKTSRKHPCEGCGRPSTHHHKYFDIFTVRKLRLTRLPFVDGCYDQSGAYWGSPANVWCAWTDGVRLFVRADDRETAKKFIREKLPTAKFYR